MMFYLADIQSKSANITWCLLKRREMVEFLGCMFVAGDVIFRQKGKFAFMKCYFASLQSPNFCLIPGGKWPFQIALADDFHENHTKEGRGEVTCSTAREECIWLRFVGTGVFWKYSGWAEDLIDRRKNWILALSHPENRNWTRQEGEEKKEILGKINIVA